MIDDLLGLGGAFCEIQNWLHGMWGVAAAIGTRRRLHKTYRSSVLEGLTDKNLSEPTVGTRLDNIVTLMVASLRGLGTQRTLLEISLTLVEAGWGSPSSSLTDILHGGQSHMGCRILLPERLSQYLTPEHHRQGNGMPICRAEC